MFVYLFRRIRIIKVLKTCRRYKTITYHFLKTYLLNIYELQYSTIYYYVFILSLYSNKFVCIGRIITIYVYILYIKHLLNNTLNERMI